MKPLRLSLALCAFVALPACYSVGRDFDASRAAEIQPGRTTQSDLVRMFGQPSSQSTQSDGTTLLTWLNQRGRVGALSWIPIVNIFVPDDVTTDLKTLYVTCDKAGTVVDFNVTTSQM